ncbi:MAG TPA: hypothetical protein VGN69_09160 [Solirubrobacteraceae bacterium]|jgi:hypothetical protein|nr:hypothetical protein [Solirubrobacteraceae bacterium]
MTQLAQLIRRLSLTTVLALVLTPTSAALANTSHAGWPHITGVLLMNKLDQSRPLDARPGHDPFDGADSSYSCDGLHHSTSCVIFGPPVATDPGCVPVPPLPVPDVPPTDASLTPSGPAVDPASSGDAPSAVARSRRAARAARQMPALGCPAPASSGGRGPARLAADGHNELLGGHGNNTIHAGPHGDVIWGDYKPKGDPTTQVNHLYGGAGNDFIYAAHGANYIWTGAGRDVVHAHFGRGAIRCQSSRATVYLSHMSRPRYHLFGCRHISYKTVGY